MFAECRIAVESGYWPLYRYNPALIDEGKNVSVLFAVFAIVYMKRD